MIASIYRYDIRDMKQQVKCNSVDDLLAFAAQMGSRLRGGEVIELVSDVGGGKTTFVKGLAKGAGSKDHVSSPTYKISNIYKARYFEIYHFDFYRLPEAGLIEHELADIKDQNDVVIVVEWSNVIAHALPKDRTTITIGVDANDCRMLTIEYPKTMEYLIG